MADYRYILSTNPAQIEQATKEGYIPIRKTSAHRQAIRTAVLKQAVIERINLSTPEKIEEFSKTDKFKEIMDKVVVYYKAAPKKSRKLAPVRENGEGMNEEETNEPAFSATEEFASENYPNQLSRKEAENAHQEAAEINRQINRIIKLKRLQNKKRTAKLQGLPVVKSRVEPRNRTKKQSNFTRKMRQKRLQLLRARGQQSDGPVNGQVLNARVVAGIRDLQARLAACEEAKRALETALKAPRVNAAGAPFEEENENEENEENENAREELYGKKGMGGRRHGRKTKRRARKHSKKTMRRR